VRKAVKFYYENSDLARYDKRKLRTYIEMLAEGEHVILDIDHLVAFLKFIETRPKSEDFWNLHRENS